MPPDAWSGPHGSAAATRTVPFKPALGDIRWLLPLAEQQPHPPLADEAGVYLGFRDNRIVALTGTDGRERWHVETPGDLDVQPVLVGDLLVAALRNGLIIAYDRRSGAVAWAVETRHQQVAPPVAANGVLWTSSLPELAAIDAATGRPLWQSRRGWDLRVGALAIAGPNVVVGALRNVFLLDRATGAQRFFLGVSDPRFVATSDSVVIAASARHLVAFDPDERRPWWERFRGAWNWAYAYQIAPEPPAPPRRWVRVLRAPPLAPALDDERVYVADDTALSAYALTSGDLLWTHAAGITAAPIATAGGVLVGTRAGLLLLHPERGEVLGVGPALPAPASAIAVVNGMTYVLTDAGLVAVSAAH